MKFDSLRAAMHATRQRFGDREKEFHYVELLDGRWVRSEVKPDLKTVKPTPNRRMWREREA